MGSAVGDGVFRLVYTSVRWMSRLVAGACGVVGVAVVAGFGWDRSPKWCRGGLGVFMVLGIGTVAEFWMILVDRVMRRKSTIEAEMDGLVERRSEGVKGWVLSPSVLGVDGVSSSSGDSAVSGEEGSS